jgi:hypothetical protein
VNNGDKVRIKGTDLEGRYLFWMGTHNVDVPGYSRFTLPADLIEPVVEVLDPVEVVDIFGDKLTVQQGAGSVLRIDVPGDVTVFFLDRTNTKALICALQAILTATPEENNNG